MIDLIVQLLVALALLDGQWDHRDAWVQDIVPGIVVFEDGSWTQE